MSSNVLPRILVVDDLLGRTHRDRRNEERANFCGQYLIEDVTGDQVGRESAQKIKRPMAQAVFCRGQQPSCSAVGGLVQNDLAGTLAVIRDGWLHPGSRKPRWAMLLLDLCFYTGRVTEESNQETAGMPEGCESDRSPQHYFGLQILEAIHAEFPELPVVILSAQPRDDVSHEFTRRGALGFLARDAGDSIELLREYLWRHGLIPDESGEIIGRSLSLLLALRTARRAAPHQDNILIRGERGTGKELMANYIYRQGKREGAKKLVKVNSGGLSAELYASTLFGHEKGSFTGATETREGEIARADGSDLFLDEIGNMPPEVQAGMLRVLEYGEVVPVGAKGGGRRVNVRFLAATNEDIEAKASWGHFRSDLLDRLRMGGTVFLPPLRERLEDIPLLVERFVRVAEEETPGAMKRQIDPEAMDCILSCPWPGNVRELAACIRKAVKQYPDLEHLVPLHIQLPAVHNAGPQPELKPEPPEEPDRQDVVRTLDNLIQQVASFPFDPHRRDELAGKFPRLQQAVAQLLVGYLKAALEATGRYRPAGEGKLELEVLIHPAMRLVTGDGEMSASQAADLIKRIVRLLPEGDAAFMEDPVLKEAYGTAVRLRPRQSKKVKPPK
jgi:DNA-binding NtrC family response regulator